MELTLNDIQSAIHKQEKKITEINTKIDVRRNVMSSKINSNTVINKGEKKVNKTNTKINNQISQYQNTLEYWNNQLTRTQEYRTKAIEDINKKYDQEEERILSNVKKIQTSISNLTESFIEEETQDYDEQNDVTLSRLKVELKNAENELATQRAYFKTKEAEYEQYRIRASREAQREYLLSLKSEEDKYKSQKIQELMMIKNEEQKKEEEHQKKLRDAKSQNPEEFLSYEEKEIIKNKKKQELKEFKNNYKHVLDQYIIVIDNSSERIFDYILKDDLDKLLKCENEESIKKYLESVFSFYKKKITFDTTTYYDLPNLEQDIYSNLLHFNPTGYKEFFELPNTEKRKRYLLKYKKEYEYKLAND